MNRQVLKSNSAFVAMGQFPAWKTGEETANLFPLVQNCSFSIKNEHQKIKQIGSQSYAVNNLVKAPEANIDLSYYLNPYCSNEILAGFKAEAQSYQPCLQDLKNRDQNIYIIVNPDDQKDGFDNFKVNPTSVNFSGMQALTFGNCFLNSYSVDFALNTIPTVSMGFDVSNVRFENLTRATVSIPAINSVSGNNSGSGFLNLSGLYSSLIDGYIPNNAEGRNEFNAPVVNPNTSNFSLQNLQVGGVGLGAAANPILQSFNLNLDLARTNLYGLGSNYAYGRKLEYPVNGSAAIQCLVSGISSGEFQSIITNESGYSFEVAFCDTKKLVTGYYQIQNAKLESVDYSMNVNDTLKFNANFSFEATETGGFLMKRNVAYSGIWSGITSLWQNIIVNWSDL
jgi:hypothetical protein